MKLRILSVLFMSAHAYSMSDPADSAAAAPAPVATKESIIERVEALFEKGYDEAATVLHDLLTDVESVFEHKAATAGEGATPAASTDAGAVTTGEAGNDGADASPASTVEAATGATSEGNAPAASGAAS
jgi:hypothetical protein